MSSTPDERRTAGHDEMTGHDEMIGHDEVVTEHTRPIAAAEPVSSQPVSSQRVATQPVAAEPVATAKHHRRTTDLFHASLGLFLLRLITAGILGIHGYQHLANHDGFKGFLTMLSLPSPNYLAWGVGIAEMAAAVALVLGLLTRLAGLCVCALMVGILVRVLWQHGISIHSHDSGFKGELELLLGTVGLMFALLGGGRWGIDGAFRGGRARNREAR